jgi:cysteinyl-tRNA synthetase
MINKIFGIIPPPEYNIPADIKNLCVRMEKFRTEKKWEMIDSIKKELTEKGYKTEDTVLGTLIIPEKTF